MNINRYLLLIALFTVGNLYAQQQRVVPASPESASLAKFINYPVSLNTGIPDISIPLFEVKSGSLSLPIVLSYHAGGIKVNEKSTWVGLGWGLSAEPEVTRVVNGNDDFANYGYTGSDVGNPSLYRDLNYMKNLVNAQIDENPDDFYYHLSSKSGKFYFHKFPGGAFNAIPIPYEPLDIKFNQDSIPIKIVDDKGLIYNFGDNTSYTHRTAIESHEMGNYDPVTSWRCTQMISSSKADTISFTYSQPMLRFGYEISEKYVIYDYERTDADSENNVMVAGEFYSDQGILKVDQGVHKAVAASGESMIYNPDRLYDHNGADSIVLTPIENYKLEHEEGVIGSTSNTIKIKEIKYRSGKVQFFQRLYKNMLDSIRVLDDNNILIKSVKFYYTFWYNARAGQGNNAPDDRIRLDSIAIKSKSDKVIERYSFDYNSDYGIPLGMKRSDIRGYYSNSNISFVTFINDHETTVPEQTITIRKPSISSYYTYPPYSFDITIGSLPNSVSDGTDYAQAFMLRKVHYPTGGYAQFNYENNQANDQSNALVVSSGLRIKSIKYFKDNTNSPAVEKNYKYGINETGRGITTGLETISTFNYEQTIYRPFNLSVLGNNPWKQRKRTYNAKSFSDLAFSDGSPVVYQEVTEYQSDMGAETGKTIYKYDYPSCPSFYDIDFAPMTLPKSTWNFGTLTSKIDYASLNGNYIWVKKNDYTYKRYIRPDSIYVGMVHPVNIIQEDSNYPYFSPIISDGWQNITYAHTYLSVGKMLPLIENEYSRDIADTLNVLAKTQNYFYDNSAHMYPSRVTLVNSKKDSITNFSIYPQDYLGSDPMISPMIAANMLDYPIEQVSSITHFGANVPVITKGSLTTYYPNSNPASIYSLETATSVNLTSFKFSNVSSGTLPQNNTKQLFEKDDKYALKLNYDSYDSHGKIRQFTSERAGVSSYKWDYKGNFPIVECERANFDEFLFEDFEGNGSMASNYPNGHTGHGAFTGSINLGNLFSSTFHGKAYVVSYFSYDGTNWHYIHSDYTGQMLSGILDDISIYPKNATISTYTYDQMIGMTTSTNPRGQTTFYEYDGFQRLSTVRDQNGKILKLTDYHYKQ
jgi:YD repeat-containing protein